MANTSEFQVNTFTYRTQENPSIIGLADGGWLVVWQSSYQDGDGTGIFGQRYAQDGTKVGQDGATIGAEFQVNTHTNNYQESPSITALADGGWLVTWASYKQDGDSWGIFGQRYTQNGKTLGDEFQVNTYTNDEQSYPSTTALADGGWLVTWESSEQDGSLDGIFAQRYAQDGTTVGNEFQVNTYTSKHQSFPSTAALADGGWVVTWQSTQDGSSSGIFGQRYAQDGTTVGDEFQVNTYTHNGQYDPSTAALADGGWLVVWSSPLRDGPGYGIFGQRYAQDGTTVGNEFQVNTHIGDQGLPSIAALADGGWLVTWASSGQDGDGMGIFGQRYAQDGTTVGDEFQVNTYTSDSQTDPSTAALADGGWVVTWESGGQDGENDSYPYNGVFGQRYNASGTNDAPVASAQSLTTNEDTVLSGTLPTGSDVDGDRLSYAVKDDASHGSVTINTDGTFSYTPDANYNGSDSFTYVVNDGTVDSAKATVSVTVTSVNDAPVASAQSVTTNEDTVLSGTLPTGSDVDGDSLSYTLVDDASHGSVTITSNGEFTYTPLEDFFGSDSFSYKVNDGSLDSNASVISLVVNDVPEPLGTFSSFKNHVLSIFDTQQVLSSATTITPIEI